MLIKLLSFLFGIYWGLYLKNIVLFLCILILILILYFKNKKAIYLIFIALSMIGFFYISILEKEYKTENYNVREAFKIISLKEETDYNASYIAKNKEGKKVKLYIKKDEEELLYGDRIYVQGIFSKAEIAKNENGFNYRNYLKQKKIHGFVFAEKIYKKERNKNFLSLIYSGKKVAKENLRKIYSKESFEFLSGILLGDTSQIEDNIKENFKLSNLSHILAISGMHISYLILFMILILKKVNLHKKIKYIFLIIFLLVFLFIIDFPVSAMRACIMTILGFLAFICNRKNSLENSLCITMFIILIINPYSIQNVGMWLSFGGYIGIIVFDKIIQRIGFKKDKKNKIKKLFLESLSVSISVQIIIFPIMLYAFHSFSITFFISNFLISPLIGPILILGYLSIFEGFFNFSVISFINQFLINILFKITEFCSNLPGAIFYIKKPSIFLIFMYYTILFLVIKKYKKNVFIFFLVLKGGKVSKKRKHKVIKQLRAVLCIMILIIICVKIVAILFRGNSLNLFFIDVGQGDCTLIKTPKGKNILIDGGEVDYGKDAVFPFLLDKDAKKIDYLFVSHFDSDHCRRTFLYNKRRKC